LNIKEGPSYFTKTFQKPALLNAIGQKKVAEYEMDLIASRRYQPGTEEPAKIDCVMMPVSELPVSAGLGAFLEGEMFQQIQVPASSVPEGTEFGIYVSGDSMEPRYHDGQIVWVKHCEELECGDIGIFVYDDCGYLKKYDEHTPDKSQAEFFTDSYGVVHNQPFLVSLNTKYSPILISPEQRFEIVGKVLN
jgi:phage repressor protein C with HTH and peptisase S24 domain